MIFDERKGVKTHGLERNQRLRRTLHGVRYRQNHESAKNDQNVKRLQNDFQKRILKCSKLRNGTKVIRLVDKDGNKKNYTVAQIVARTFIENDDPKRTFVRHIDGKEGNNNVKNLKWDYPGRAASTDYRFKKRKKSKNRNPGPIQAFKNNVFCGEFQTATEAARHFGFKNTVGICLCLKGKQKTAGGMEWRRKEE